MAADKLKHGVRQVAFRLIFDLVASRKVQLAIDADLERSFGLQRAGVRPFTHKVLLGTSAHWQCVSYVLWRSSWPSRSRHHPLLQSTTGTRMCVWPAPLGSLDGCQL